MQIDFNIENQRLNKLNESFIVENSQNYLECSFIFSDDWQSFKKLAYFQSTLDSVPKIVEIVDDKCIVPHESIKAPFLKVWVIGYKDEVKITTNFETLSIIRSGVDVGDETIEKPSKELWETLFNDFEFTYDKKEGNLKIAMIDVTGTRKEKNVIIFSDTDKYIVSVVYEETNKQFKFTFNDGDFITCPFEVDLGNYYTKTETNTLLDNYYIKAETDLKFLSKEEAQNTYATISSVNELSNIINSNRENIGSIQSEINVMKESLVNVKSSADEAKNKAQEAYNLALEIDGSPKGVYANLSALQTAFPSGASGVYITSDNGHWYYWNGTAWTDGGVYHSSEDIKQLKEDLSELSESVYMKKYELFNVTPTQGFPSGSTDNETTEHDSRISNEYPIRVKANDTIKLVDSDYKFAVYFKSYTSAEKTSYIWSTSGWKTSDVVVSDCILNDYALENGCVDIRVTICKVDNTETVATSIRMCDVVSIIEEFKIQENDLSTEVRTKLNRGNVSNSVKFAHLSFDDVRFCMEDITNNATSYNSLFDNPFFAMLKNLHDTYGTVVSLYLFTTEIGTFTDKFKNEFEANSDWLKFGLHLEGYAGNYSATTASNAKADYDRFTSGIVRITGTTKCIDKCPRLSNFGGNLESCLAMRDANGGCVGFLSAYDDRQSYYLSTEDSAYVFKHGRLVDYTNHLTFYRTLRSLETASVATILNPLLTLEGNNGSEYGIIMMHEYEVYNSSYSIVAEMVQRLQDASAFMVNNGYAWEYPMNKIIN